MSVFPLKVGDRLPLLRYALRNGDGTVPDLTGAQVYFSMQASLGVVKIARVAATVLDAVGGVVSYAWQVADVDTAGLFHAEFVVVFPGGKEATYPNCGFVSVLIGQDI